MNKNIFIWHPLDIKLEEFFKMQVFSTKRIVLISILIQTIFLCACSLPKNFNQNNSTIESEVLQTTEATGSLQSTPTITDNENNTSSPVDDVDLEISTGISTRSDISYYRSLVRKAETDNIYIFGKVESMTPEIALELVMGIILSEAQDLEETAILRSSTTEGSLYEYIINSSWVGDGFLPEEEQWQYKTNRVACLKEFSDSYYVVIYEFFIDGFENLNYHTPIVQEFEVFKENNTIVKVMYSS